MADFLFALSRDDQVDEPKFYPNMMLGGMKVSDGFPLNADLLTSAATLRVRW